MEKVIKESFNVDPVAPRELHPKDEEKFIRTLENTCKKISGHYKISLSLARQVCTSPRKLFIRTKTTRSKNNKDL